MSIIEYNTIRRIALGVTDRIVTAWIVTDRIVTAWIVTAWIATGRRGAEPRARRHAAAQATIHMVFRTHRFRSALRPAGSLLAAWHMAALNSTGLRWLADRFQTV